MEWPLLASLPVEDRAELLSSARRRRYERGSLIVREGGPGDSLHLVEAGRLAVQVSTPAGDSATLNVLSPGDFFGELSLLRADPPPRRTATVVSLEPASTLMLSGNAFHSVCGRYPRVEQVVVAMLAQRVEELSQRLLEALYLGVDRRVTRRLVELTNIYGRGDVAGVTIPLTQDDLAGMAGASRPTVNQVLQKLVTRNIISLRRGQIVVLDHAALTLRGGL